MQSHRVLHAAAVVSLLFLAPPAFAATYRVGPGHPYADPGAVPWESLAAGDSVVIHARTEPYRHKWVICRAGAPGAPIVVHGVPGAGGAMPVIDGANAVTRPSLNYWNEERGVLKIGGANNPPDTMPAWVVVEYLEIRGARPENTFTGRNGLTSYAANAAAIYIEKGQHVVIRGCRLTDCSNGFFCASQTSDLLVEANAIWDNGNAGSIYEHNNYTEALGITFQFNHFGPLRAGAGGNNLKDRSAGAVIRYNWIEGGNRQLDLVESDDAALIGDPRYRETFVYGNVLVEPGDVGNSQIAHYGGDGGTTSNYRKGTLYFHHNTAVSRRSGNTTLLRLSTPDETADVRNNVIFVTAAGNRLALLDQTGTLTATRNWMKTGWVASHGGGTIVDNGQITGSTPGFEGEAAGDFGLTEVSACLDAAVPLLPETIPDHVPAFEYVKHQLSRPRPGDGAPDLGAYERAAAIAVAGGAPAAPRLVAWPNPSAGTFSIAVEPRAAAAAQAPLEVFDPHGRRVSRVEPHAPGSWRWTPPSALGQGYYFARLGDRTVRLVLVR